MTDILSIAERFRIEGKPSGYERIGSGHINDSYHVITSRAGSSGVSAPKDQS